MQFLRSGLLYLLQCVAVCCNMLQCVAVRCCVLQRFATCCDVLVAASSIQIKGSLARSNFVLAFYTCCSVLQSVVQRVAVLCSVMQCVAVHCSVLTVLQCAVGNQQHAAQDLGRDIDTYFCTHIHIYVGRAAFVLAPYVR